jgi:3-methyladenine DNA glycosylase/8-oxoguanine DNA glycosylase
VNDHSACRIDGAAVRFMPAGPFDLALSLRAAASFLPPQGPVPSVLRVAVMLDGQPAIITVAQNGRQVEAAGSPAIDSARLRGIAAWLVSGDLDVQPFYALSAAHPVMARIAAGLHGLKPLRPASLFEMLVIAITEQQLSLAAAFHIRQRLVERFGRRIDEVWLFPTPAGLAKVPISALRENGLSGRKAEYITALAGTVAAGRLDLAALKAMSDADARAALSGIRGIGDWSIEYILARGLGRVDCLPAGDVGLRRVVGRYLSGGARLSPQELQAALAPFAPYRSLAAYYLAVHARLFADQPCRKLPSAAKEMPS